MQSSTLEDGQKLGTRVFVRLNLIKY